MKFAVHTEHGVILIETDTPDEARNIARKKYGCKIIKKVKAKR